MATAINELFEKCSCDMPLSMYQYHIETKLQEGMNTIDVMKELNVTCMGCMTHIINKPMTTVMDNTRDSFVDQNNGIRERGYVVTPKKPIPNYPLFLDEEM